MTFLAAKLQGSLSELSQIIAAKTIKKKSILLTDSDVQTLLGFGNDISCGWEQKMTTGRFPTG